MTKKLRFLMTALLICVCGMTWAETYTLTIDASNFNSKSYADNNNEKTSLAVSTSDATKTYEVKWTSNQIMLQGDIMQWQKSKGYLYNSTDLGKITNVTINSSAGSFTTYYGSSVNPTSETTVGGGFFTTKVGGATGKTTSVVITFTIDNPKEPANLSYDVTEVEVTKGDDFTAPVLNNPNNLSVTYSSDASNVASVDENTGAVSIIDCGVATIIATFAGNDEYNFGSAQYTITVKAAKENAEKPANALFFDAFNNTEGTGGHDGKYSGTISTSTIVEDEDDNWKTIDEKCGGAFQCVKFGSSSAFGTLTTKAIELTGEGTLTFSAAGWGDSNSNTLKIEAEGADVYGDTEITLENGVWNNYTVNIKNAEGAVTITFSGKRGFIDDVLVVEVIPTTVTVNIPARGWASYCSKYDVESTATGKCYMATKLVNGKVTVVPVEGTIKAGTGMLVKGSGSVELAVAATAPEAYADMKENKLVGVLEDTDMTGKSCYILSDGAFYPCTGGTLAAGKAYLDIEPANAKVIDIDLNGDETAISTMNAEQQNGNIYTINGVQVKNTQQKGIYIINGKKVVK